MPKKYLGISKRNLNNFTSPWVMSMYSVQFSSVQSLNHVRLFATPWIAARQASLSITNSRSSLRFTSIESVMPSSHLILCRPLLLLPPIPPSIRVSSNESTLHMRWPKYWSFSFSIIPSKEIPGLISFIMDWLDLLATANGDCSHEIKRRLLLRRNAMTNLESTLKSRVITLPTNVHIVKAIVFQ